jgi:hypothetical protein
LQSLLPLITGSAGALVVLALGVYAFYTGKIHSDREFSKLEAENDQMRAEMGQYRLALDIERRTVNETVQAGTVTNQLITALTTMAAGQHGAQSPGLTAEDIGL